MSHDITESKKVQRQIERFTWRMTQGLKKTKKKFISQMIFGIQASRDIKLSMVARSLKEEIRLIKTENRLSRQMMSADLTGVVNERLVKDGRWWVKKDTVLALDLSDVHKAFAKKMDGLAKVWDGSEGEAATGYWLLEVIGAEVDKEHLVPLYSELYSHKVKEFVSENEQILAAVRKISAVTKGKGIWAMDRGFDRGILVGELNELKQRFVIRVKDRNFTNAQGKEQRIKKMIKWIRCTERYRVNVDQEGYKKNLEISVGVREKVFLEGVELRLVVAKGFGKEPMVLMTNVNKTGQEILEIYLTRWKCEEAFRFLKQEYHLEDVRVRRYLSLRNTMALLHAVFYFVSVYLGQRLRMTILLRKILERSKRFFEMPVFKHYAVADGIYRLLFNLRWEDRGFNQESGDCRQMSLGFG